MKKLIVFALIAAAAGLVVLVLRPSRPAHPTVASLYRSDAEARPKADASLPSESGATETTHGLPAAQAGSAAGSAGRMTLPGGSFLLTAVSLVSPADNHLTEAAVDVLKLQPAEVQAVESLLASVSEEVKTLRRSRDGVHRQDDGSIKFDTYEKEWAGIIAAAGDRLKPALDDESASALRAVGMKQLLTSPSMLGLVAAEPIPDDPTSMLVRVRDEALTFRQKLSREKVESLLAP